MPFTDLRSQATRRSPEEMLKHLSSIGLDHEAILYDVSHPDKIPSWLEAYLVRAGAPHPDRLPPLPPPRK